MNPNTKDIDCFLNQVNYLKEAEELLSLVYLKLGPYGLDVLDEKSQLGGFSQNYQNQLSVRIKNHFKFDDSE